MKSSQLSLAAAVVISLSAAGARAASTGLGPTPYLSFNDSPFKSLNLPNFHLETFENDLFDAPGVTASTGVVVAPGSITDSVDGDDGKIDGSGTGGHSFFSDNGAGGITFTFNAAQLGGSLPTHAGIVWTDGAGQITFEAFGPGDVPLVTIGPVSQAGVFPDDSISGTTAEDRFFGVISDGGISKIFINNTSGGIEVDHLQYNGKATVAAVPLPTALWPSLLTLGGMGAIAWRRRTTRTA